MTHEQMASDLVRLVMNAANNADAERPITLALARAHAEGLEAGRRGMAEDAAEKCAELARECATKAAYQEADGDLDLADAFHHESLALRYAEGSIRSLIPAAPEVQKK